MRLIKVVYLLKCKAPASLSDMEYYAIEKDYEAAAEKAEAKLDVDLAEMARKYNTLSGDLKRYYENRVFIDLPTL